jgi:DUF2971 family protein
VRGAIVGEFLECALTSFDLNEQLETYVTSFCENGDLLSQWRGYGETAGGFSIGVSFDTMCDLGGAGLNFFVCRTIYSRDKQQEVIDTIIQMTIDGLKRLTTGMAGDAAASSIRQCCKVFQSSLWMMLVLFKNPAFEEEREWRAIRAVAPDLPAVIKHRGQSVPYLELTFQGSPWRRGGRIPIRHVYHGPTADPHVVEEMKHLLSSQGHEQVTIDASQIPLRQVGV